jgi:hypothetical protein
LSSLPFSYLLFPLLPYTLVLHIFFSVYVLFFFNFLLHPSDLSLRSQFSFPTDKRQFSLLQISIGSLLTQSPYSHPSSSYSYLPLDTFLDSETLRRKMNPTYNITGRHVLEFIH